jgi:hypothetical protein
MTGEGDEPEPGATETGFRSREARERRAPTNRMFAPQVPEPKVQCTVSLP